MENKQKQIMKMEFPKEPSIFIEEGEEIIDTQKGKVNEIISGEILGEYVKINVETLTGINLKHTLNNLLSSLQGQYYLLTRQNADFQDIFDFGSLVECVQSGRQPDFISLLRSLIVNYTGGDLKNEVFFEKIINTIKIIEYKIQFTNEEKFEKKDIHTNNITRYVYDIIKHIEYQEEISLDLHPVSGFHLDFQYSTISNNNNLNIEPILLNLIVDLVHNAIKYSDVGKDIKISLTQKQDSLKIIVKDEGFGMKEDEINKSFEYGVRLEQGIHKPGNGVGANKCIFVVDKLGGDVYVRSKEGQGTEVKIIIPNNK